MRTLIRNQACKIFIASSLLCALNASADTMGHYMNIADNIPLMEIKADPQAQAWARSARNILILTSESIIESLSVANEGAKQSGKPMFCLKPKSTLTATEMNDLIQKTFKELATTDRDKNNMTVSQLALMGLSQQYPCESQTGNNNQNQLR